MADADSPALFPESELRRGTGLDVFRRRLRHARPATAPVLPDPLAWAAAHPGARGRAPSGTVHEVTARWLPACGAGLNGWDARGLVPTADEVTCARCLGNRRRRELATAGQLELDLFR
ncbi:hypothetical protein [Amycolatopsis minnesotensis]|uniref:Uncharacterized protein n=1 Tax=Amycolatopsis minnesotensis TaxID=337894 RepID=A0ABN2SQ38_9PSEU